MFQKYIKLFEYINLINNSKIKKIYISIPFIYTKKKQLPYPL